MRLVTTALVALTALVAVPALAASWQAYRYPDLAFSVDFPGAPTRFEKPIDTTAGAVPTVFVFFKDDTRTLFTSSSDLTNQPEAKNDPSVVARAVLDGALSSRTVLSQPAQVSVPVGAAWEATSQDATTVIRTRVLVSGVRAYTAMVIAPADHPERVRDADSNRFLNSLAVIR
jgi:hypothetical protein